MITTSKSTRQRLTLRLVAGAACFIVGAVAIAVGRPEAPAPPALSPTQQTRGSNFPTLAFIEGSPNADLHPLFPTAIPVLLPPAPSEAQPEPTIRAQPFIIDLSGIQVPETLLALTPAPTRKPDAATTPEADATAPPEADVTATPEADVTATPTALPTAPTATPALTSTPVPAGLGTPAATSGAPASSTVRPTSTSTATARPTSTVTARPTSTVTPSPTVAPAPTTIPTPTPSPTATRTQAVITSSSATAPGLADAFLPVHGASRWPVPAAARTEISSTFGPRIKLSTGTNDFHRGIDISAPIGSEVIAAYAGTLFDVRELADGGLTIILRHELPAPITFNGQSVSTFHTFYMHLSAVAPDLQSAMATGDALVIAPGQTIGAVGDTGSTVNPHLHFEVRLGSWCSLEFQLLNPSSSCSSLGADPHVHPMMLFPPDQAEIALSIVSELTSDGPGRFSVSTADIRPVLNRYEFVVLQDGTPMSSVLLELNRRTGYDASTTSSLDAVDTSTIHLAAQPFGAPATRWSIDVVVPPSTVPSKALGQTFALIATDIWGRNATAFFGDPTDTW